MSELLMRNIKFADELITKTFGVNGYEIELKKFQIDKSKLVFVLDFISFTVQFDIRTDKVIHKFDGDQVNLKTQGELYDKAQHIRQELYQDEDDNQMTIEDVEEEEIEQAENESLFDSGGEKVEELSNEEID